MRDKRSGGPQYWNDDCGKPPDFDLERCEFAKAYAELITVSRTKHCWVQSLEMLA